MDKQKMNDLTLYKLYRRFMKSGDMLEFASATTLGRLIRWVTKKNVNHTALLLSLDKYSTLKDRRFLLEALEHGVELNLISGRLDRFKGFVYWSALKPQYNDLRPKIAVWALDRVGTSYDYSSLLANMFGKVSQDAKDFFCSEYYQMSLASVGLISKTVEALRPGEFEKFMLHEKPIRIL